MPIIASSHTGTGWDPDEKQEAASVQLWVPTRWPGDGAWDLFISVPGRAPTFGSPCKELETGRFNRETFLFEQFLRDFQGGWLSKLLQADLSPLAEKFQPPPPGSCWAERVMGAVSSIVIGKLDFQTAFPDFQAQNPQFCGFSLSNCF